VSPGRGGGGCSGDDISDDSGGRRDHNEKVEKAGEKQRRRMPQAPTQELRETPPSGAEPSEGEEVWLNGKDAQRPAEKRPSSWWQRMFGG
jgi:hypothetical protein